MREFDLLGGYPEPKKPRYVNQNLRTIKNRITASYRSKEYFDGNRNDGYAGMVYDLAIDHLRSVVFVAINHALKKM